LGNPTADLDSVVGSIAIAFFSQQTAGSEVFIPVINCPSTNIDCNSVLKHLLDKLLVSKKNLLFFEELDAGQILDNRALVKVTLHDWNVPDSARSFLAPLVSRIIDHH